MFNRKLENKTEILAKKNLFRLLEKWLTAKSSLKKRQHLDCS